SSTVSSAGASVFTTVSGAPGSPAVPLRLILIFVSPSWMENSSIEDFSMIFTSFSIFPKSITVTPIFLLLKQLAQSFRHKTALQHLFARLVDPSAELIHLRHLVEQELLRLLHGHCGKADFIVRPALGQLRKVR